MVYGSSGMQHQRHADRASGRNESALSGEALRRENIFTRDGNHQYPVRPTYNMSNIVPLLVRLYFVFICDAAPLPLPRLRQYMQHGLQYML